MKKLLVLGLVLVSVLGLCAGNALAAKRHDNLPLHVGSSGPRVAALQWEISGHRPNIYKRVKPTYHWDPKIKHGYFGAQTLKAVKAYRWELGMPVKFHGHLIVNSRTVGKDLFNILQGKHKRPIGWVVRAGKRLKAITQANSTSRRIAAIARSQIGNSETWGDNWGPKVSVYQSVTGQYHAAWCVSFAQWVMVQAGVGTFADRSAGVFYVVGWAHNRGYLNARAKVGALVAFTNGQGHMGVVVKVGSGWFVSVEGNHANRVAEVYHRMGDRPEVFVYLPRATI
jgi:hypothetical protein